jgi:hypothetical protein
MKKQTLRPTSREKIVIATAHGLIIFRKAQHGTWEIELPDDLTALKSTERAVSDSKFVEMDEFGTIRPRYTMLSPIQDADGKLLGIRQPEMLRLKEAL